MERLWSYLRHFGRMTKEMRPSHRVDVLTHVLLHYARKKKQKMSMYDVLNILTAVIAESELNYCGVEAR